jgi:hypothetical protein
MSAAILHLIRPNKVVVLLKTSQIVRCRNEKQKKSKCGWEECQPGANAGTVMQEGIDLTKRITNKVVRSL